MVLRIAIKYYLFCIQTNRIVKQRLLRKLQLDIVCTIELMVFHFDKVIEVLHLY